MSIYEYDEAKHIELERKDAMEEGMTQGTARDVANLMKNLQMTAEQAMDALGIPKEERKQYL